MQSSDRPLVISQDRLKAGVSVIIPTYNCGQFLATALESVFSQTLPVLETIVVDDGSTDHTASVVRPYLDRITYIKQENKGLPGARNTGILASKGSYIALLDADDAWTAHKTAQQMPRFSDTEIGIVYSDFSVRYADGRAQQSYLINRPLATEGSIIESYVQSRFLFPSTMIFRRACFEQIGYFDEEMLACEDVELFARMCAHWRVALVNEPLTIRYEGTHNITSNSDKLSYYTILALKKVLRREPNLSKSTRRMICQELGRQHAWAGYSAFKASKMDMTRTHLLQAIRFDPWKSWSNYAILGVSLLPKSGRKMLRRLRDATKKG